MSLCVVCPVLRPQATPRTPSFGAVCGGVPDQSGCRDTLEGWLDDIPKLYSQLPAQLTPGGGGGEKVSGTREAPLPVRLDVLSLLGPGSDYLSAEGWRWANDQQGALPPLVVLERNVRDWLSCSWCPVDHWPREITVKSLAGWLGTHLQDACDHHPGIDEFAKDIREVRSALRGVVGAGRKGGDSIWLCPAWRPDGTRCLAALSADPYVDQIACRCGATWMRRHWLHLAAEQQTMRAEISECEACDDNGRVKATGQRCAQPTSSERETA